ncbi:MAG: hypothetical protein QF793_02225 [Candidatus Peribacteraceae bacterium]|jgi:hypothetical protein|nr:hypothetical protein [Candidatus Peribacteraceae bacterium]
MKHSSVIIGLLTIVLISCSPATEQSPSGTTIEEVLSTLYAVPAAELTIEKRQQVDRFMSGRVTIGNGPGGGVFYAVKQNDLWIIAAHGNGLPECSELDPYGFPAEIAEVCLTEDGSVKER